MNVQAEALHEKHLGGKKKMILGYSLCCSLIWFEGIQ